jgi:hypothetical protein
VRRSSFYRELHRLAMKASRHIAAIPLLHDKDGMNFMEDGNAANRD